MVTISMSCSAAICLYFMTGNSFADSSKFGPVFSSTEYKYAQGTETTKFKSLFLLNFFFVIYIFIKSFNQIEQQHAYTISKT